MSIPQRLLSEATLSGLSAYSHASVRPTDNKFPHHGPSSGRTKVPKDRVLNPTIKTLQKTAQCETAGLNYRHVERSF